MVASVGVDSARDWASDSESESALDSEKRKGSRAGARYGWPAGGSAPAVTLCFQKRVDFVLWATVCFAGLSLSSADSLSCCSGIYDVPPYATPFSCPSQSVLFPGTPGASYWIKDCSQIYFSCQPVKCFQSSGAPPVYVSRCAANSTTAIAGEIASTGGLNAGCNCNQSVIPISSAPSNFAKYSELYLSWATLLSVVLAMTSSALDGSPGCNALFHEVKLIGKLFFPHGLILGILQSLLFSSSQ